MAVTDNFTSTGVGETKDEGVMEEGQPESGNFEASGVRFDGLFAYLRELKESGGGSHPTLVSVVDELSALGMEELMKNRFYDQLESLRDFTKMYGDCLVPADHPTLGGWVRLQHKHYMLYKKRLPSPLTSKRFTKLKEIPGFDELFEKATGEKKDDSVSGKMSLDEKIRLKKAMKKVRLMAKGTDAFTSSKKKLPEKEMVAAQIRRKRAKGTSHRLAVRKSQRMKESFSLTEKESPTSATSDDNSILGSPIKISHAKEHDETPGPACEDPLKDMPTIAETFEDKIRRKLVEDDCSRSATSALKESLTSATSDNNSILGSSVTSDHAKERNDNPGRATNDLPKDRPTIALTFEEKIRRKLTEDGRSRPTPAAPNSGVVPRRRRSASALASSNSAVDRYERRLGKLEEMVGKLLAEGGGENEPPRQTKDKHLTALLPANASGASITFEDAVGRESERRTNTPSIDEFRGAARERTRAGEADRIRTGPGRSDDCRLGASAPANPSVWSSTFEDWLHRKLNGEALEDIYGHCRLPGVAAGKDDDSSVKSWDSFDGVGHQHRTSSVSSWVDKLNGPGWDSRDDMGVMGAGSSVAIDGAEERNETPGPSAEDSPKDEPTIAETFEEKIRRKHHVAVANGGIAPRRRRKGGYCVASAPASSNSGGGFDPLVDRYKRRLEEVMGKPSAKGRGENKPRRQRKDKRLAVSLPTNAFGASVAFKDAIRRESEPCRNTPSINESGEAARERTGAGEAGGIRNGSGRLEDHRFGASVPANLRIKGSTFDNRLQRKLNGEALEDIYKDWPSAGAMAGEEDDGSVESWDSFDGVVHLHRTSSVSSWVDKLNGPGWDSRDDTGVMDGGRGSAASPYGRGTSWANLGESCASLTPGRTKYSRWKLLFIRSDHDDRNAQSGCVADVLDSIVCSQRWNFVPKENGDVALEMTTRTPDEHRTVELNVRKLKDMYSRSDFYFY